MPHVAQKLLEQAMQRMRCASRCSTATMLMRLPTSSSSAVSASAIPPAGTSAEEDEAEEAAAAAAAAADGWICEVCAEACGRKHEVCERGDGGGIKG